MNRLIKLIVLILFTSLIVLAQDDPTVYVTKTGSKYHSTDCGYLRSRIPMKLSEAAKSYSPCSRCNPGVPGQQLNKTSPSTTDSRVSPESNSFPSTSTGKVVGQTPTGKTIYEGPRGGRYHYSKSGKKVYERKKR